MSALILAVIVLTLFFEFLNGIHDSSNVVATMISSRAFSARTALTVIAIAEFCGPFIFGVAVARTIGNEVVPAEAINHVVLIAALSSAVLWNLLTWYLGIPSSSSHALIGGLIGAVILSAGWQAILLPGIEKILLALFAAPILGLILGYLFLLLIQVLSWKASPGINRFFRRSQLFTGVALALSHGANDAPKAMGVITLALVTSKVLPEFNVPLWVKLLCAGILALGTAVGGMRIIKTVGGGFFKIRPIDGFTAQLASAAVVIAASLTGGPVSTSQVVSSAIMGAGAAERLNKVRWNVAREIAITWLLTIPVTALMAAGFYGLFSRFLL